MGRQGASDAIPIHSRRGVSPKMGRTCTAAIAAAFLMAQTEIAHFPLQAKSVDAREDKPADGPRAENVLEFRILASRKHDARAIEQAMRPDGLEMPPEGYRWARFDERSGLRPGNQVITREEPPRDGTRRFVLVKLDPQNITEEHLSRVESAKGERSDPAISITFSEEGRRRLGALTNAHLPEEAGLFKYQLAIIVEGRVITAPFINSRVTNAAIVEMGSTTQPGEVDRLIKLLRGAMAAAKAGAEKRR